MFKPTLLNHFTLIISMGILQILTADEYDFSGSSSSTESGYTDDRLADTGNTSNRKDRVSSSDVFELFKADQKVAIVSKKEQSTSDAPATVYVVTDKEIKERGYMFLHDLLRDVPGFDLINDLGTYGMLAMQRGIDTPEGNKTLIFIDGMPTNNPSQGVSYISYQFSLHNVKRVEILWGPASALYGANAFAGIINIVTKDAADLENEGKLGHVGMGFMSFSNKVTLDGSYYDFLVGNRLWDSPTAGTLTLSGHYIRSENGPNYARRQPNYDPSKKNDYYFPGHTGSMPMLGDYNIYGKFNYKDFTLGGRLWNLWSKQGGFATYNYSAFDLAYWGFQGQDAYLKFAPKWNNTLSTFHQITYRASQLPEGETNQRPFDADRGSYGEDSAGGLVWYKRNDYAISADNQVTLDWRGTSSSSLGVFYEYAKVSNWNTNDTSLKKWNGVAFTQRYPDEIQGTFDGNENIISEGVGPKDKDEVYYTQNNFAFYAQHSETVLKNITFTVGGRGDLLMTKGIEGPEIFGLATASSCTTCQVKDAYTGTAADAAAQGAVLSRSNVYYKAEPVSLTVFSFNPRAGVVYKPSEKHTVKLLHGWAFRNPTVRERFSLSSSRIPAGANLKPEQIKTTELGYAFKPFKFLRGEIDGFWSEVEDIIQLSASKYGRPGKTSALAQFQNVGKARLLGFEVKTDIAAFQSDPFSILFFANYSFQYNRYTDIEEQGKTSLSHDLSQSGDGLESKIMPRVASHKANLGISFYFQRFFSISPIYHYVSERPNVISSPIESIPEHHLLNLSVAYANPAKDWDFSIYAFNVLDQIINDPGTRDAKGDYYSPVRPIARFSLWAKWTYKL